MFWIALLFMIAALPWVFPTMARLRPFQAAIVVLLLGTVLGPAFFAIDGPIQLSLDRLVWMVVIGLIALRWLRRSERFDSLGRVDLLVVAMVAWAFFSCLQHGMTNASPPPAARWFFYLAMPCSMYFVMRLRDADNDVELGRMIQVMVSVVIGLGVYLSLTSVFEMIGLRSLVFPKFINDPKVWEFFGRGRGPLLNPAGNGILMTLGLAACVTRFFQTPTRWGQLTYVAFALIALAGCYATLTRSVWMGAAMTMALLGLLYVPFRIRMIGLVGVVLIGGVMMTGLKDQLLSFKRDKNLSAAEAAKSVELRPLLAIVAVEMFKDRPITGHGYGQYYEAAEPYHAIRTHDMPLETVRPYMQHNVFLSAMVDLGLIGLVIHGLLVVSLFCVSWRLCCGYPDGSPQRTVGMMMIGMLAGYLCNGLFHEVAIISMVHMYLFTLAGLTITVARWSPSTARSAVHPERRRGVASWNEPILVWDDRRDPNLTA